MAQRRSPPKKTRSNSGASRRSAGARKKSGGAPGWVWLVTGLLAGLFIAFLILLHNFKDTTPKSAAKPATSAPPPPHKETKSAVKEQKKPAQAVAEAPQKKESTAKTKTPENSDSKKAANAPVKSAINYDFYKILPKSEVVIPEEEINKPANTAQANAPGTYYLQVGAFRRLEEADSRKAELAMLGIVTTIQTVTIEPNNSWHRVRVGPVKDMRQLDRDKRLLQSNNIAYVTVKEKN